MTLAEFNAVVDKRVAWRVLFKVGVAIIGGCATLVTIALGPVLWVYGNVNGTLKDVARLEQQVNGLSRTVGELQIIVAQVGTEVRATRGDSADIKRMLEAQQRPAPPARTANVPTRRSTQ